MSQLLYVTDGGFEGEQLGGNGVTIAIKNFTNGKALGRDVLW